MFTGIIEEIGSVVSIAAGARSARLTVGASEILSDIHSGDSIAVNGICLTVIDFTADRFTADVMPETMERTNLGRLRSGSKVNLERALTLNRRLGGHVVTGHIDGVGTICSITRDDNAYIYRIGVAASLARLIVVKGSVTVDGVSLTVVDCGADWFSVSVIPHTREVTILAAKRDGDPVNVETDIIGKYVARLLECQDAGAPRQALTREFLLRHGF